MTEFLELSDAAALVAKGASVVLGGFQLERPPMALVRELVRQGRGGLRVLSLPNPLALDLLIAANLVAEAEFAFGGFAYERGFVIAPNWRRAIERNLIVWREKDAYCLVQRLRAGAMGLPFIPVPDADRGGYRRMNRLPKLIDPFTGSSVPVEAPATPDVALVHAQAADRRGNLFIANPVADDLIVRASHSVLATVERVMDRLPEITVPSFLVSAVVECPQGAWPGSCRGHYDHDAAHIAEYLAQSETGSLDAYFREHVYAGVPAPGASSEAVDRKEASRASSAGDGASPRGEGAWRE